jgi:hypothetical protein
LSFQLRKAGKSIRLSDNYIGTVAEESAATVYTLDRRFKKIQCHIDITLLRRRERHKIKRVTITGFKAAQFNEECSLWPEVV